MKKVGHRTSRDAPSSSSGRSSNSSGGVEQEDVALGQQSNVGQHRQRGQGHGGGGASSSSSSSVPSTSHLESNKTGVDVDRVRRLLKPRMVSPEEAAAAEAHAVTIPSSSNISCQRNVNFVRGAASGSIKSVTSLLAEGPQDSGGPIEASSSSSSSASPNISKLRREEEEDASKKRHKQSINNDAGHHDAHRSPSRSSSSSSPFSHPPATGTLTRAADPYSVGVSIPIGAVVGRSSSCTPRRGHSAGANTKTNAVPSTSGIAAQEETTPSITGAPVPLSQWLNIQNINENKEDNNGSEDRHYAKEVDHNLHLEDNKDNKNSPKRPDHISEEKADTIAKKIRAGLQLRRPDASSTAPAEPGKVNNVLDNQNIKHNTSRTSSDEQDSTFSSKKALKSISSLSELNTNYSPRDAVHPRRKRSEEEVGGHCQAKRRRSDEEPMATSAASTLMANGVAAPSSSSLLNLKVAGAAKSSCTQKDHNMIHSPKTIEPHVLPPPSPSSTCQHHAQLLGPQQGAEKATTTSSRSVDAQPRAPIQPLRLGGSLGGSILSAP
eukprot:GSA25T00012863001.1